MNIHLQPHLDTDNIKHPKSLPWLYNQLHPPNPDTTPQIRDLFRSQNPHVRQWTRPRNKRLPDSQSRIDLIIASTSFISIFNPQNTFINTTINNSEIEPHGVYIVNSECTLFELRADSDHSSSFIIIIIHHASCVMCHASCVMTCWRPSMCFSHSNLKLHFRSELTQPQPHSYGFLRRLYYSFFITL